MGRTALAVRPPSPCLHVVLHSAASVDGRIDGFEPDVGLYYALADAWTVDVHLVGADTLLAGLAAGGDESAAEAPTSGDEAPLLVVTDSRGRVDAWDVVRDQPFWGDVVVCRSERTPRADREDPARHGVEALVRGEDRVDLPGVLDALADRGVGTVLVDSGGSLGGTLLHEGPVNEVSVVVHPVLVGGTDARSFVRGPGPDGPTRLELRAVEQPAADVVWYRYAVVH